jgi:hypothetical protein
MSCTLIRYTYDKNLEMIQPLVQEFSVLAPWWPSQETRLDRNLVCELLLPSGTYVQSFGSITPAVMKHALLTDDGRHMIVSPAGEPKTWAFFLGCVPIFSF